MRSHVLLLAASLALGAPLAGADALPYVEQAIGATVGSASVCVWVDTRHAPPLSGADPSACGSPVHSITVDGPGGSRVEVGFESRGDLSDVPPALLEAIRDVEERGMDAVRDLV